MKICINRKPIKGPWGGGNLFVKSFCKYLRDFGHQVVHTLDDNLDIIFMQDPRYDNLKISINEIINYKKKFPNVKIIHRINECDARKNTDDMDSLLLQCSKYTDFTIFVSNWIKEYHFNKGMRVKNFDVIYNGVNKQYFRQNKKLNNFKINIVAHHWSNNFLKGFDIYEKIDEFVSNNDSFTFTYIGRENGTFKNTNIIKPLFGKDLGHELGKYDVYVSASRYDPGPNHVLESLACRIPTYVISSGGGSVEFAGLNNSYNDFNDLKCILLKKEFKLNDYLPYNWKTCAKKVDKVIKDVINFT
jgi:hypothetical protein